MQPFPAGAVPMGINKVGNQFADRFIWMTLSNWTERAGFPGTVYTTTGLVVPAGTYNIGGLITYTVLERQRNLRVYRNSTLVWDLPGTGTYVTSLPISGAALNNVVCSAGDVISVQASNNNGGDTVAGGVNTYLTATPV